MRIVIGEGSCGIAAGAQKVRSALEALIDQEIGSTGCIGMCYLEPIVDLYEGKQLLRRLVRVSDKDVVSLCLFHDFLLHSLKFSSFQVCKLDYFHRYEIILCKRNCFTATVVIHIDLTCVLISCIGIDYFEFVLFVKTINCIEELDIFDAVQFIQVG